MESRFADEEILYLLSTSFSNNIYRSKVVCDLAMQGSSDIVLIVFDSIDNNRYIFSTLTGLYRKNKELFNELYDSGNCFTNAEYNDKMIAWISENGNM